MTMRLSCLQHVQAQAVCVEQRTQGLKMGLGGAPETPKPAQNTNPQEVRVLFTGSYLARSA